MTAWWLCPHELRQLANELIHYELQWQLMLQRPHTEPVCDRLTLFLIRNDGSYTLVLL